VAAECNLRPNLVKSSCGKSYFNQGVFFERVDNFAKRSELFYEVIDSCEKNSLIEVTLSTGRFHQIRAQIAFSGHPIIGDIKYGAPDPLPDQKIALFACKLVFNHPISREEMTLTAPEPEDWSQLKT
jgi:23S rRNA pseudouridine1911/1915/1917 synthase